MIPAAGEWNPEHKVDDCKYILYTMYHTVSHCLFTRVRGINITQYKKKHREKKIVTDKLKVVFVQFLTFELCYLS